MVQPQLILKRINNVLINGEKPHQQAPRKERLFLSLNKLQGSPQGGQDERSGYNI
jgi:hypothetical protein